MMAFQVFIKRATELTLEEETHIGLVDHLAYTSLPPTEPEEGPTIEWTGGETIIFGVLDGTIVSQVQVLHRVITVDGQPIPVGGIGGVATHPDFQRRGFAEALMRRAEAYLRDELKVPFGLLVCSDYREKYYQKLGWQTVAGPMVFETQGGKRQWNELAMVLPLTNVPWPVGIIDVCGKPW
jgi:predicted acetyltransferase